MCAGFCPAVKTQHLRRFQPHQGLGTIDIHDGWVFHQAGQSRNNMTLVDEAVIQKIVRRGVAEIISLGEFVQLLKAGKPLRLKMGFDPSRPDIHLGHVVGLRKLRQLQDLGHQVVLIVGDWTAQIGDPSGQSVTPADVDARCGRRQR